MCICLIINQFPTNSCCGTAKTMAHCGTGTSQRYFKPPILILKDQIRIFCNNSSLLCQSSIEEQFLCPSKIYSLLKKNLKNLSLSYCTSYIRTFFLHTLPQTVRSPIYSHLILGLLFSFTNVASNNSFCFLTQPWICCQLKSKINRNLHLEGGYSRIQTGEPPAFLFGRRQLL